VRKVAEVRKESGGIYKEVEVGGLGEVEL